MNPISSNAIKFAFRTSDDGTLWSTLRGRNGNDINWDTNYFGQVAGESAFTSIPDWLLSIPPSRFIDIAVRLESDGSNTPVLNDVTLEYELTQSPPPPPPPVSIAEPDPVPDPKPTPPPPAPAPVAVKDTYKPRTYAKGTSAKRKGRRKTATARLRWKVKDNSSRAYVKLRIQKRIKSRSRTARKARYLRTYRKYRGKYLTYKNKYRKIRNRTLRRRYQKAAVRYKKAMNKYLRAYRKTKTVVYKTVRTPNYRWTSINKWRTYKWKTRSKGVYRYLVYAKDRAGNNQRNVAKAGFRIR